MPQTRSGRCPPIPRKDGRKSRSAQKKRASPPQQEGSTPQAESGSDPPPLPTMDRESRPAGTTQNRETTSQRSSSQPTVGAPTPVESWTPPSGTGRINPPDLLQLLAQQQLVLTELARTLASQQQRGASDFPQQPLPSANSAPQPPVVRGLPTPKLQSPDSTTIPQFRDWKQRWEDYSRAQQLQCQSIDTQHGVLRSALDTEWTILWNSGRIPVSALDHLDTIIGQMEGYLRSRRNPLLDRQLFHRRDQMAGESVDRYYAALKTLDDACAHEIEITCVTCPDTCNMFCTTCEVSYSYEHLQQTRIRDRLICGLRDKEMQKKVLAEPFSKLTLDEVLYICSAVENSNATGDTLRSQHEHLEVSANRTKSTYKKEQQQQRAPNSGSTHDSWTCWYCGSPERHSRALCKAKDNFCKQCKQLGHFAKMCDHLKERATAWAERRNQMQHVRGRSQKPAWTTSTQDATTAAIQQLLTVQVEISGIPHLIQWLPDTGAQVDAISEADFRKLGAAAQRAFTTDAEDVIAANGMSLGPVGSARATLHLKGREYSTHLRVFKRLTTPLLSKRGCIALGLIDTQWPYSQLSLAGAISSGSGKVQTSSLKPMNASTTRESLLSEFAPAFNDEVLRPMEGAPMKIELLEGAIPSKRYKAHSIPFHWRGQVKDQLDSMEHKGIIERVPVGEGIEWCHPMVVVPKKGSSESRITVDLTGLNKFVRRPAYPTRVPKEVVARIPPGNCYFSTLDARHGYWQVPLDEDSRKLTTFITPWGSYRFQRNVMGLVSAGDEHNRRGDEALHGIQNTEKIVEDIIVFDKDFETHVKRVREVIQRCLDHGITLNPKKFEFAQSTVQWCGFQVGPDGYTPAPHLVSALLKFPTPTSKTDVRSFCGLVQQFEAFSHRITELIAPIRSLLSSKAVFLWETVHERAFEKVIKELSSPRVLTHFQPGYPLRLETDAAQSKGLGYALWQQQPSSEWKLLQAGSRYVTPTESRYSASEIEMLAVVWAIKKCRLFLLGHPFELIVDHRPLIPIINSKTLDEIENTRLQRLKEKLSSFRLTAIWRAGAKHKVVDVFSRFPVADPDEEDLEMALDEDPTPLINAAIHDPEDGSRIMSDPLIRSVKEAAHMCSVYRRLLEHISRGFPEKSQLDEDLHPYWRLRDSLIIHEDLIFLGSRILIPAVLRPSILKTLHQSHQGQERTLRRARQAVFWPNITNDVRNVVRSCRECQAHLPSLQKEPLVSDPPAEFPFQVVGADLFSYAGYEYLVMVDEFSGWTTIGKCGTSATTAIVTKFLQMWMTDLGIPVTFRSDNGPQFASSEFREWAARWGIVHRTSSPHYPQSNGLAESAVKGMKYLLEKSSPDGNINSSEFQESLMEFRNTPRADGRSPAQMLFGAPTRTRLVLHRSQFLQEWRTRSKACDEKAIKLREKAHRRYDESAKPLPELSPGDVVLLQDPISKRWTTPAEILEKCSSGRSYLLRTEAGRVLRRNRKFVRRCLPSPAHQIIEEDSTPPVPRRSKRQRHAPQRFACSIKRFQGIRFRGGHVASRLASPQEADEAAPTRSLQFVIDTQAEDKERAVRRRSEDDRMEAVVA